MALYTKLTVFLHALDVDGATLVALRNLQTPIFRDYFRDVVVVSEREGPLRQEFARAGAKVLVAPAKHIRKVELLALSPTPTRWRTFLRLQSALRNSTAVWINSIDHPAALYRIALWSKAKLFLYVHEGLGSPFASHFLTRAKAAHIRRGVKTGKMKIGFPSQSARAAGMKALDIKDALYMPYGIASTVANVRNGSFAEKTVQFCSVGWICDRKAQNLLVYTLATLDKICSESPGALKNWHFTFMGVNFKAHFPFMQFALHHLPCHRVSFVGQCDNLSLRAKLRTMHCLVSPSFNEALPVNVMEQMSDGGLVIASDCEGQDELIKHGQTGLAFERGDFAGLLDRMLYVLDPLSATHCADMAANAAQVIRTQYSVESSTRCLLDALT